MRELLGTCACGNPHYKGDEVGTTESGNIYCYGHKKCKWLAEATFKCPICGELGHPYNIVEPEYKCPNCGFTNHHDVFEYEYKLHDKTKFIQT